MSLLSLIAVGLVVAAIFGLRRLAQEGEASGGGGGSAIRRFFQYLLLYGLLVVVAIGLAGLISRLLGGAEVARLDQTQLARSLTFVLIGGPLYTAVAIWSRRRMTVEPGEARSFGWAFYVTLAALTALFNAMVDLHGVLSWLVGTERYDGADLAGLIVWGTVWAAHWLVESRITPRRRSLVHHLVGSLAALGTSAVGLGGLLAAALRELMGMSGEPLVAGESALLPPAVTLVVGASVWSLYWLRTASGAERTTLWLVFVLLFGVGAGLIGALGTATALLYQVLVWLVGDPETAEAARHFDAVPGLLSGAVVGVVAWWYHRSVLEDQPTGRTEVRRVYEYLMAGIGLLAAASGLATLVVALLEVLAGTRDVVVEASAVNTVLAAVTTLAVGAPVWWVFWGRIQRADPSEERPALTRRVYLFLLFGLGGVAAVIALITAVFTLLEDAFEGNLGAETVRSMRFAVGTLFAAGALAAYHLSVFRADQARMPVRFQGPRYVLLIGAPDSEIAREVARRTGGRVQAWSRLEETARPWSVEEVMEALAATTAEEEVVVVAGPDGLEVIPVDRP
ncbi:MAG: DUF5671 domain-containing protein [Actinomycetota bacterium]